jgi:hypothetical protein
MLKTITKIDMLKEAVECIESIPEFKGHIKLDLSDETESGADISFIVYSDIPLDWKTRDKIVDTLYNCLEKYDPYITLYFEWEKVK